MHFLAPGFAPHSAEFDLAARCLVLAFPLVGASFVTAFATAWFSLRRAYLLAGLHHVRGGQDVRANTGGKGVAQRREQRTA